MGIPVAVFIVIGYVNYCANIYTRTVWQLEVKNREATIRMQMASEEKELYTRIGFQLPRTPFDLLPSIPVCTCRLQCGES